MKKVFITGLDVAPAPINLHNNVYTFETEIVENTRKISANSKILERRTE